MSGKRQSCSFVLTAKARNGTDGQGEENVYIRTKGAVAPYIADGENPVACIDSNGKASSDDGYLPSAGLLNGEVESNAFGESEWGSVMGEMTEYGECTAVPNGASEIWPYEWEAKRKKGTPNAASGVRVWEDYDGQMTLHERWARDAETYEIVFTEAWAKVSMSDEITARLRGYAYKVKGSTRTLLTGVTIMYGYIIDDSDTYSTTTTNNNGYFSESEWFDGDEFGPQGYNKGSKTVFAAIIVGGAVVCAYHVLMIKEAAQGQQGSTGKMCPIVGAYDPNVEYKSNSLQTVAVEVENTTTHKTELWYLTAATNVVNGVHIAPTDSNQSVWSKGLNEYNLIRAKYLFADFAQLGSFVVSQDFFLSQYGTLFGFGGAIGVTGSRTVGKVYMKTVDGKSVPYYAAGNNSSEDKPCYTFFAASDPMAEDVQNGPAFTLDGNGISGVVVVRRVWFMASAATTVSVTVSPSSEANYDWGAVGLLDSTELSADGVTAATVKNGTTDTLVKASGTTPQTATVSVGAGMHFFEIAYLKDANTDSNNDNAVFTFTESGNSYVTGFSMIVFRPMKVVNALTGEEWGAGGNFALSRNGDVRVNGVVRAKSMETTFADLTDKYRKDGSTYEALDGGTGSPGEYVLGEDVYEKVGNSYVKFDISGIYNFVVGNTVFILPSDSAFISQRVLLFNGNVNTAGGTCKGPRVKTYEYENGLTTTRYLRGVGKEAKYNGNTSVPSNHVLPSGAAVPLWSFDAVTSLFFVNGAVELIAVPDTEDATLCEWTAVNIGTNCYMIE